MLEPKAWGIEDDLQCQGCGDEMKTHRLAYIDGLSFAFCPVPEIG